jgi:Fur family transcriptional regulator, ferric uptake regulator
MVGARLRAMGQRYTGNRRLLVGVMLDADHPLTLPEILRAAPQLAQSSVYRNLALLEQAKAVHRITGGGDHARYELAEELTEHHHHLICSSCGTVQDFLVSPHVERTLRLAVAEARRASGFAAQAHRIDLIGVCARCA